jgi:peptide/nickel transport system ATP-binding protein
MRGYGFHGPVLETRDVHRHFRVSAGAFRRKLILRAVNGVSLAAPRGGVLGLVGESGCGKTTLAQMLLGLLAPTRGEILLDGKEISSLRRQDISRTVQPVFQDPYSSLNPRHSLRAIISLPLRVHRVGDRSTWGEKVQEMMDLVGLPARLARCFPGQLSGGQRQRVAIARALIMRPEVVICDEPTSALDVSVQAQILNLLLDLRDALGLTYILISHNLSVVEHLATRVAVMYLGRIVEERPAAEMFQRPAHPYTQALLASALTPEPGLGLPKTHLGIAYPNPMDPPGGCTFHPRCPKAEERCARLAPEPIRDGDQLVECHFPQNR